MGGSLKTYTTSVRFEGGDDPSFTELAEQLSHVAEQARHQLARLLYIDTKNREERTEEEQAFLEAHTQSPDDPDFFIDYDY